MKKALALVLTLCMLLSMGLMQFASADAQELTLWHNRSGTAGQVLEELIAAYNDGEGASLGVKITPIYQGNDLISKLKTLILANDTKNMPDMVQVFAGDVEYMSTVPYVVPMETFVAADDSFSLDAILPQLLYTYTYGDVLYSMPFHASTLMFYWNKTAFAAAGLDPETPPTTIAEIAEIAPALLTKSGNTVTQYAISLGITNNYINHWIGGQGEYSFVGNEEAGRTGRMTRVTFDEDGTMAKLLTEWKKVLDTGAVQYVEEGSQNRDEFIAGLSAMIITSNSSLGAVSKSFAENGWEFGIGALPKVDAGDTGGVAPGGSSIYIMDKGSAETMDKCWAFIKHWVSPEVQFVFATRVGTIPVNSETFDLPEMVAFLEENPYFLAAYDCLMASNPKVQEHLAPTQQAFAAAFKEVGLAFAEGELTVDEAVAEMAERCNAALDEYNLANPIE